MTVKQREVYHGSYFRRGGSYAVLIPPDIRELMSLNPGDSMLMNCEDGVLWMVKATRSIVIDRTKMTAIFDKLYAEKVPSNGRNT